MVAAFEFWPEGGAIAQGLSTQRVLGIPVNPKMFEICVFIHVYLCVYSFARRYSCCHKPGSDPFEYFVFIGLARQHLVTSCGHSLPLCKKLAACQSHTDKTMTSAKTST